MRAGRNCEGAVLHSVQKPDAHSLVHTNVRFAEAGW
jgi:hypothetical protein